MDILRLYIQTGGKQFLSREFLKVFMDEGGNFISKLSFGDRGFKDNIYIGGFGGVTSMSV